MYLLQEAEYYLEDDDLEVVVDWKRKSGQQENAAAKSALLEHEGATQLIRDAKTDAEQDVEQNVEQDAEQDVEQNVELDAKQDA